MEKRILLHLPRVILTNLNIFHSIIDIYNKRMMCIWFGGSYSLSNSVNHDPHCSVHFFLSHDVCHNYREFISTHCIKTWFSEAVVFDFSCLPLLFYLMMVSLMLQGVKNAEPSQTHSSCLPLQGGMSLGQGVLKLR